MHYRQVGKTNQLESTWPNLVQLGHVASNLKSNNQVVFNRTLTQELVPAIELDRMTIPAIAVDTLLQLVLVDERHDLREDGFTIVHDLRMAAWLLSTNLPSSNRKIH